ncbi:MULTISPECIES: hypothetical protein [Gordonia]|uniref:hypothetical protein n=1 Tax=Gordonia TaxID=2053 RepID=UPI000B3309DA|nr:MULTISPECIES: hypothetical protein [Gordonia]WLP89372.1 hypothetical protein Q9K23_17535 [Gordonia sp. NB41Y]
MTGRIRRWLTTVIVGAGIGLAGIGAGPAQAAPSGPVDPGVPFSSVVYGTGCTYSLVSPVNASGLVSFYEQRRGYPPILIGRAQAYQLVATVWWTPRRIGDRILYAEQNGVRGPSIVARVHQGYGSGGVCFAL